MTKAPGGLEALLGSLHERFGESLRSCVEYFPESKTIHYLRDDIDRTVAEGRLVRIEELYQAERLTSTPIREDPPLETLDASIHLFGDVLVVHLVDPSGRVIGFSVDSEALSELRTLVTELRDTAFETE